MSSLTEAQILQASYLYVDVLEDVLNVVRSGVSLEEIASSANEENRRKIELVMTAATSAYEKNGNPELGKILDEIKSGGTSRFV